MPGPMEATRDGSVEAVAAGAAPAPSRSVWGWVILGCGALLVLPCILATVCTMVASRSGPEDLPVRISVTDKGVEIQGQQGAVPESMRQTLAQALIGAAHDTFSSDARDLVVKTVPQLPGGITASESLDSIRRTSSLSAGLPGMIIAAPLSAVDEDEPAGDDG